MNRYRDMSSRELVEWALHTFHTSHTPANRLIYALAKRLEQEATRAERLADRAAAQGRRPVAGKPHITLVRSGGLWPTYGNALWRCRGPFGGTQYGNSPVHAYANWRAVIERPARLICLPNNLN